MTTEPSADLRKFMYKPPVSRAAFAVGFILLLLFLDQWVKIYVKTHFFLGECVPVFSWFELRFVQNPGMAFGMELGSKLFLTIFRIIVVIGLIYYLCRLVKRDWFPIGYVACISLIIAGALGNIIDCVFYGLIFNNPMPPEVAHFVPFGHGYATVFHGMVVDMLYFPLFSFTWPDWVPGVGGHLFTFFDPVFNIADAAITVGMLMLIIFYSKYLGRLDKEEYKHQSSSANEEK